jgi:hypothetical protein
MKDLEPILNILCNYHTGLVLSDDEIADLRGWLAESGAHEDLFDELGKRNGMQLIMGSIDTDFRERIRARLIEMEEEV